jgi:hypothetical protein
MSRRCNSMIAKKSLVAWMPLLCLCLLTGITLGHAMDSTSALNSYKDLQSNFDNYRQDASTSHPEPVFVSPEGIRSNLFDGLPSSEPVDKKIALNATHSKEQVQDLVAMNTVAQRDIVYDDVQRSDLHDQGRGNSMDIEVAGNGQGEQDGVERMGPDDELANFIEERVDAATASSVNHAGRDNAQSTRYLGNSLNIDVHGITVTATNTVPGGSAIATSNIKIEPVQIIMNPSEVSERLK